MSRLSNDPEVIAEAQDLLNIPFGGSAGDPVADPAALTAAAVAVTFTSNGPTANGALTVADGDAPTDGEIGEAIAEFEAFSEDVVADLTELRAQLIALITSLEAAGYLDT